MANFYQDLETALSAYHSVSHPSNLPSGSLALHIRKPISGSLKLHTPDGLGSLSLTCGDDSVFWSFLSHDLYDCYLVRSYAPAWQAFQPLGYIRSQTSERIARLPENEQALAWNKHFVAQLIAQNTGLLGAGEWHFIYQAARDLPPDWGTYWADWCIGQPETNMNYRQWLFSGSRFDALDNDRFADTENFIALKTHHSEDGRLKYWRKQARQNQLAPVLAYSVTALADYSIILDGHLRLAAALAENRLPSIITIYAAGAFPQHADDTTQQAQKQAHVLAQYAKISQMPDIDQQKASRAISQAVVQAFDNRPFLRHITRAAADISPQIWLDQMLAHAKQHGFTNDLHKYWLDSFPVQRLPKHQ